ncbi:hypothetical protein JG491_37855 [Streptomyces sp. CRPSP2-6A1]|uniref:hypothetical protein n=1 Tax=Streptomyces sp. CRPSP2-6A1 TaxID=2799588 RepID=UPI0018F08D1D|nr:hypothetical protein [Streptomyces sp. CRPSP2-6A1]MBJ7005720.1 hypothetical protein [Streptomyces sp. CRPSP2-6A1]
MTTNTSTWQASVEGGQERLDRWRRMLAGAPAVASRRRRRRQNPETNVATGVWLHTAARAEMGRELTEWEQSFLEPLIGVLGEGEVWALGRAYREQRDAGTVALVPQAVVRCGLDEPFTPEDVAARIRAVGELAADQPNVAWVNRTRLLAGEQLETDAFSEAADAYGYGLTLFNGAQFGTATQEQTGGSAPTDEAASNTPFRAKLEWAGFRCRQAAGDQWGGRDEIYWTAACQSHNYKFHTRTGETGEVSSNNDYPISGEHGTGRMAFFDASFTGNLSALMITCWEADQSNDAWYTALGKALGDAVDSLSLVDFALNFVPGADMLGYMIVAMDLLATFWEALRNHDDMVLTRGVALNRSDLKALYYTEGRRMTLQFNARSSGMGHFALHVKYTGDTPPGPPPEGSFQFLATGWTGLLGSSFTRNLDAACLAPGSATDVYLFQGDQYARYNCRSEDIGYGTKKLSDGWPGLRGTNFTSNLDAACLIPGSTTHVYLFKGDQYVNYDCRNERANIGRLSDGWPGLRGTNFTSNLDAACSVPGSSTDVYLFKGDQYVRYDCRNERIRNGVQNIITGWPRLADTEFAYNLQAGCAVPGSGKDVYLFKGERYVRYTI